MNIEKIKRYSLVEVSLLAIFMLGLLLAGLMVRRRSRVILSELIPLPGSGLAVSLPDNPGWERTPEWQYEEAQNSMRLISQFGDSEGMGIEVRWRYIFSTANGSEQELLKQKAQKVNAAIEDFNTIGQKYKMTYARFFLPQNSREMVYIGIMRLDFNRSLELLVRSSYRTSGFYEENILVSVAESIQYHPLQEATDGHKMRDSFLSMYENSMDRPSLADESFLLKTVLGKNQGYYYARFLDSEEEKWLFRAQIKQFEFNSLKLDSQLLFNPSSKDISWNTTLSNPRIQGTLIYKISLNENNSLSVTCNDKEIKTLPISQFLPEPFLDEFTNTFLESDYNSVIIDILAARGQLVPVKLTKLSPEDVEIRSENAELAVRVDFLYHSDSYEELLYNGSQKLLGKSEHQPGRKPRIWEVVSIETLKQIFQEKFDNEPTVYLLKDNKNVRQQI